MSKAPKTTDGLMRHLRSKGIQIGGSIQKRKLMNMGYYHGYKGCRYIKTASNRIPFSSFDEVIAIYGFDSQLKSLFYPYIMQIETILKNYVLETVVNSAKSDDFYNIYNTLLDNYKQYSQNDSKFKKELSIRLKVRDEIYKVQTERYKSDNAIAEHFLKRNRHLPIWAIFELLTLGQFGQFVTALNYTCRKDLSQKIGIPAVNDTSATLCYNIIFAIKDLRNAIAHNSIVFDTRFKSGKIDRKLPTMIIRETGCQNVRFNTITDYLIFIIFLLKRFYFTKTEMKKIVCGFEEISENFRGKISTSVFNQILHTDNRRKIAALKKFISQ